MAAEQDIIKEFLVSLGFKVDKTGLESFVKGITAASAAVLASVTAIEDNLERLFFASQRTKASAENIRAFGFSLTQMGSSAGAALEAVENLARFMRNSPGSTGFIRSLGVATEDANGKMRDTSDILKDLGKQFAQMPYYRANAYAQALGIDERSLMAMREGLGDFGDEYKDMLAKAGLDLDDAAKKSHTFMVETRTLGSAFVILGQKISSSLSEQLTAYVRRFREGFVDNFGKIGDVVDSVSKAVGVIADVISQMSIRAMQAVDAVAEWFKGLDEDSKNTVKLIGAIGVAWTALGTLFAKSPIGRIFAAGTALLALYDDYKGWKEGAKHLIPWEQWEPEIQKAERVFASLGAFFRNTASTIKQEFALVGEVIRAVFEGRYSDAWKAAKQVAVIETRSNVDSVTAAADSWRSSAPDTKGFVEDGSIVEMPPLSVPRGIRNNNPGNIEFARQPGATLETSTPDRKRFAQFRTPEEGLAALSKQLQLYGSRGIDTLNTIMKQYAPAFENNTAAYVKRLSSEIGVGANDHLDTTNPDTLQRLMGGIIRFENANQNPYSAEQLRAASMVGAAGAPGGATPVINQTNNINVTGMGGQEVARSVSSGIDGANARLIRNVRTVAQ